jgi:hypothetical protein
VKPEFRSLVVFSKYQDDLISRIITSITLHIIIENAEHESEAPKVPFCLKTLVLFFGAYVLERFGAYFPAPVGYNEAGRRENVR